MLKLKRTSLIVLTVAACCFGLLSGAIAQTISSLQQVSGTWSGLYQDPRFSQQGGMAKFKLNVDQSGRYSYATPTSTVTGPAVVEDGKLILTDERSADKKRYIFSLKGGNLVSANGLIMMSRTGP
jgi:hypothetical protein